MTTKDRLEEFQIRSQQFAQMMSEDCTTFPVSVEEAMSESEPLLYTEEEWSIVEEFLNEVDRLQRDLHLLETYIEDVKMKHSQLLISPHGDEKRKEELDQAMEAFRQLSESTRTQLKTGTSLDKDEVDNVIESGKLYDFAGGLLLQQTNSAQILLDLESRRDDILKLENSIRELHQMFLDMAVLVESQGEVVDRIENHIMLAVDYSQRAGHHMVHAHRYQDKYRKKKICLICLVPVLILIVLVIGAGIFCTQFGCGSSES